MLPLVLFFKNTIANLEIIYDKIYILRTKGFNIPIDGLSSGKVRVNINLSSGEKTGMISGEVEI